MGKPAKVFRNRGNQLVRLPKEFQFEVGLVYLERHGEEIVLSARRTDWALWMNAGVAASWYFLPGIGFPAFEEDEA